MKKLSLALGLGCILGLTGCDIAAVDKANQQTNEENLRGPGEYIGTLPNGKKLVRYRIVSFGLNDQYVYVIDPSQPITTNTDVRSGKTTYTQVTAVLPPEATANQ